MRGFSLAVACAIGDVVILTYSNYPSYGLMLLLASAEENGFVVVVLGSGKRAEWGSYDAFQAFES